MFGTLRQHLVPEPNRIVCLDKRISYSGAAGCSLNIDMTKTDAVVFCFQVLCRNFSRNAAKLQCTPVQKVASVEIQPSTP